jgi:hypothetical protein
MLRKKGQNEEIMQEGQSKLLELICCGYRTAKDDREGELFRVREIITQPTVVKHF